MDNITKGDWYLEEETGLILSIPDGADSPVEVASVGGSQEPLTPKPLSETEANGHLIAAAVNACKEINPDDPMDAAESVTGMHKALKEIAKGLGRYSLDRLTHASNTIEDMKELAVEALAKAEDK